MPAEPPPDEALPPPPIQETFVVGDEEYPDLLKAMARHRELRIPITRKSDGAVLATVPTYRPPEARGNDEDSDL